MLHRLACAFRGFPHASVGAPHLDGGRIYGRANRKFSVSTRVYFICDDIMYISLSFGNALVLPFGHYKHVTMWGCFDTVFVIIHNQKDVVSLFFLFLLISTHHMHAYEHGRGVFRGGFSVSFSAVVLLCICPSGCMDV